MTQNFPGNLVFFVVSGFVSKTVLAIDEDSYRTMRVLAVAANG